MISIRAAVSADMPAVWPLVSAAVADMNAGGNPQWGEDYPLPAHFVQAMEAGELYVACDGQDKSILGVVVLNTNEDEEYAALTGWQVPGPALVIHKMAVHPDAQRRGTASAMFRFAFHQAEYLGLRSIRVDTYCLNTRMLPLIEKMGFHPVGDVHFPDRPLPFHVFEKVL